MHAELAVLLVFASLLLLGCLSDVIVSSESTPTPRASVSISVSATATATVATSTPVPTISTATPPKGCETNADCPTDMVCVSACPYCQKNCFPKDGPFPPQRASPSAIASPISVASPTPTATQVPSPSVEPSASPISSVAEVKMTMQRFSFSPSEVRVKQGSIVRLVISVPAGDTTHGIGLPEFGVSQAVSPGETKTVEFTASKAGTFSFFCNVFCGSGHGSMNGRLVVE